jgi:hypothetical protein
MAVKNGSENRGIEDYKRGRDNTKRNEKLENGPGTGSRDGKGWELGAMKTRTGNH